MAKMFGKSWYRIVWQKRLIFALCSLFCSHGIFSWAVDKSEFLTAQTLKLSTGSFIVQNSSNASWYRDPCENLDLKTEVSTSEPHFEVAPNPFDKGGYIARLSLPGISVFEELPTHIMNVDTDPDLSLFWPGVRKRLSQRLFQIQKLIA